MRFVSVLTLALLTACGAPEKPAPVPGAFDAKGEIVLTVNGVPLRADAIEAVTRRIPEPQLEQMKASGQYKAFLERLALGQVLYQQAVAEKLYEEPEMQAALAMGVRDLLAAEMVERAGHKGITEAEIQAAYDERAVQYKRPAVKARHILVDDEALATSIAEQLRAGGSFEALATENSKDVVSAQRGGDLGWFTEGKMVPEFSDAAFAATGDEIIGPVKTRFGFHILQVTERRDATPLEEVRAQLEEELKKGAVEKFLKDTEASMKVEWPDEGAATPPAEPDAPAHAE